MARAINITTSETASSSTGSASMTSAANKTISITSSSSSTSDTPFFPYPSSLPQNTPESPRSRLTKVRSHERVCATLHPHHIFQLVVEWVFLITAFSMFIGIVVCACVLHLAVYLPSPNRARPPIRCIRIRRSRRLRARLGATTNPRSLQTQSHITQISRAHRFHSPGNVSTAPIILANPFLDPSPYPQHLLHPTRSNARQVRAMDTDQAGRRIDDGVFSNDHDGDLGDRDILPAYDISGGPPRYVE
jgi:hypothetical protein